MPALSICIPAYAMGGKGAGYLSESLDILAGQDFTDFEVIVSDQSGDEAVFDACAAFSGQLNIRHVWNRNGKKQASANVNNAMDHASGRVIKILFQDDYLNGAGALGKIAAAFDGDAGWSLCGSGVSRNGGPVDRPMVPRLTPKLVFGKNTVSSPSVLAFRADTGVRFDEELIWLMDVDIYQRLWDSLGEPVIVPDTLVVNRIHDGQVSASVSKEQRHKELRYVRRKFAGSITFAGKLEYLRQRLKAL